MSNNQQQQNSDTRIPYPEDTVFLVPEIPYDVQVIRGYLNKKYKDIPRNMIVSQVNMTALPHLETLKLIVLVRRPKDGSAPGLSYNVFPDQHGKLVEKAIPPETYHDEVRESPAIRVRDHVAMSKATMFQSVEANLNPLIDKLNEYAVPCRITPQNKPDSMLRFVVGV